MLKLKPKPKPMLMLMLKSPVCCSQQSVATANFVAANGYIISKVQTAQLTPWSDFVKLLDAARRYMCNCSSSGHLMGFVAASNAHNCAN